MDPIADMLTGIRNASAVENETASIPFSKLSFAVGEILAREKWVKELVMQGKKARKTFDIMLKYSGKTPAITGIRRVSKPGKRVYKGWRDLRPVRQGYGMLVISTPAGLCTDKEARKLKVGGEVLLEVW